MEREATSKGRGRTPLPLSALLVCIGLVASALILASHRPGRWQFAQGIDGRVPMLVNTETGRCYGLFGRYWVANEPRWWAELPLPTDPPEPVAKVDKRTRLKNTLDMIESGKLSKDDRDWALGYARKLHDEIDAEEQAEKK